MKKKIIRNSFIIVSSLTVFLVSTSAVIIKNLNNNVKNTQLKDVTKVLLTFDANGGTLVGKDKAIEVESTTKFKDINNKPTATKEGVSGQVGWYYLNGSNKVTVNDNTTFASSTTLYANWKLYTVTFDAGEGSFSDGSTTKEFKDVTIVHSDEITAPTLANHTFAGWKVGGTGEHKTFPYVPSGESTSITLKADYIHAETVTLAFSANGGKFSNNKIVKYADVAFGSTWGDIISKDLLSIEEPTIDSDSLFSKWNINNAEIPSETKFIKTTYIKAKYESAIAVTFDVNTNGGTWADDSTSSITTPKIKLSTEPSLSTFKEAVQESISTPKKGSVEFLGWFDNKDANGNPLNLDSKDKVTNTSSFTIYAYYKDKENVNFTLNGAERTSGPTSYIRKDNLTWDFKATEGHTLIDSNISCSWGNASKTRGTDYLFTVSGGVGTLIINDAPKGGIDITINTELNKYGISKDTSEIGVDSITVNSEADYNSTVNVSASILEGYTFKEFKVYKESGEEYTTLSSNPNSFTMPASNVKVKAFATVNNYTISKDTLPAGVASLTVAENADYNTDVTVTATNSEGYTLGNIIISNALTGETYATITSGQTFKMPAFNVKVIASATINSYTLTLDANGGTVTPSSLTVEYNKKLTDVISSSSITISHDEAAFKGWGKDTSTLLTNETMPAENKTVYAIYYKYNFQFIDGDHGKSTGTLSYDNKYTLSKSDFSSSTTITADEGYSFTGNYDVYVGDSETKLLTTDFESILKPGKLTDPIKEDVTIKIKPVFIINTHKASFNFNGGTIKKDGSIINSINIDYNENILKTLEGVTATHDNAIFLNWEMTKDDGTTVTVSSTTTMPDGYITLKPNWKTCTVVLSGDNCTVSVESLTNKIIVYDREGFSITPTTNYSFDHYEYSFDNSNWTKLSKMPFKPFVIDPNLENGSTVYLKAVCVMYIELYLYGNGGLFKDGNNFNISKVVKGNKWSDIKDNLEKPTKDGCTFSKWVYYDDDQDIDDNTTIDSSFVIKAIYI